MFTTKELESIDRNYFHVIGTSCYAVTLQSKNTKHYWHILHQQYRTFTSCAIQHKHNAEDPFHDYKSAPNLKQAIEGIKNHDHYHLYVRPLKKKRAKAGK